MPGIETNRGHRLLGALWHLDPQRGTLVLAHLNKAACCVYRSMRGRTPTEWGAKCEKRAM